MPGLTEEQLEHYATWGYVRLPQTFCPRAAEDMSDFIWDRIQELHGIRRHDSSTWGGQAPWAGLKHFKGDAVFEPLGGPATVTAIDCLLGKRRWRRPRSWGGFLVKFPDRTVDEWRLPASSWHVDAHFTHEPDTPFGVRLFSYLSNVYPRGGGTLVASGTHHLVGKFVTGLTSEERARDFPTLLRRFTRSDPWLTRLTSESEEARSRTAFFMLHEHEVLGAPVRIEELCAEAGDIVLMHPWLLHAASPNALDQPRFMTAKDIFAGPAN